MSLISAKTMLSKKKTKTMLPKTKYKIKIQ